MKIIKLRTKKPKPGSYDEKFDQDWEKWNAEHPE
jgi:hypothetical protein